MLGKTDTEYVNALDSIMYIKLTLCLHETECFMPAFYFIMNTRTVFLILYSDISHGL